MPCRDYETDYSSDWHRERYKEQCDKLARVACAAMEELVRHGKADFLILKNEEVRDWWEAHVKADKAEKARIAEEERKDRVKAEALARLSDEEKELLGLSKTKKHKKYLDSSAINIDDDHISELKKSITKYVQETKGLL